MGHRRPWTWRKVEKQVENKVTPKRAPSTVVHLIKFAAVWWLNSLPPLYLAGCVGYLNPCWPQGIHELMWLMGEKWVESQLRAAGTQLPVNCCTSAEGHSNSVCTSVYMRCRETFWRDYSKVLRCFPACKHSNLVSISKCSGLGLDLPLSVKAVGVGRGHGLPHRDLGASAVNT